MDLDLDLEHRRQAAYRRLGVDNPACLICGEADWRCLELHHVAGQAFDPLTVILCRNCHRKRGDPAVNEKLPAVVPILEQVGRLLLGLALFLAELVARLRAYGDQLLEGARVCPWPYGWVGAPADHG